MQIFVEEAHDALTGVRGSLRPIALFVVGIFKRMPRAVINLNVRCFPIGLHGGFKRLHVLGWDSLVLGSEILWVVLAGTVISYFLF